MLPFKINLTAKQGFYILLFLLVSLHGAFWGIKIKEWLNPCPEIEIINDTTFSYQGILDSSGYEPQIIIFEKEVNEDSIYQAAKLWWKDKLKPDTVYIKEGIGYLYVASKDTTYEDDLLTASIKFKSRIVLDPEGYFQLNFNVRQREIVRTVTESKTVTYNPRFFVEGGLKLEPDSLRYCLGLGVNIITSRHFKLPLTAELDYWNKVNTTIKLEAKIEF